MRKWFVLGIVCLLCACATPSQLGGSKFILLSSTIGPVDAGIVDVLETAFERESGTRVRHVGSGTGAALNLARKGEIDLVMVHAKSLEEKFVAEGFGTERIDLMYNDFVIVGPANDPAGIKGIKLAGDALKKIAGKENELAPSQFGRGRAGAQQTDYSQNKPLPHQQSPFSWWNIGSSPNL